MLALTISVDGAAQTPPRLSYTAAEVAPVGGKAAGFSPMNLLEVGPGGRLYVAHFFEQTIRVFDRHGSPIGRISAEPGGTSLRAISIGWIGDTLYVIDDSRETVTWFDGRGRRIRSSTFRLPSLGRSVGSTVPVRALSGERILVVAYPSNNAAASGGDRRVPIVTARLDGQDIDTIATRYSGRGLMAIRMGNATTVSEQPFDDASLVATPPDADHIVIVDRSPEGTDAPPAFGVHKLSLRGDTLWSRRVPYTPRRVAPEWIDAIVEERLRRMARGAVPPATADSLRQAIRAALHIPPWLPPVTRVFVGQDDRIWLRREDVPQADSVRWEILSPKGERVGGVEVPSGWSIRAADRTTAWATELIDGQRYRIWRLSFPAPAAHHALPRVESRPHRSTYR